MARIDRIEWMILNEQLYQNQKEIALLQKTVKDQEYLIVELEKRSCCGFILCCQKCGLCKICTDYGGGEQICIG